MRLSGWRTVAQFGDFGSGALDHRVGSLSGPWLRVVGLLAACQSGGGVGLPIMSKEHKLIPLSFP